MDSVDFVLFGATGDLAMKKIFRALYGVFLESRNIRIIASSHRDINSEDFIGLLSQKSDLVGESEFCSFVRVIEFLQINLSESKDYQKLHSVLREGAKKIFYLSIAPKFFTNACAGLANSGFASDGQAVVIEKPLGFDLKSSQEINEAIAQFFTEEQTYRIDHYLGKQSVLGLLSFRFENKDIDALLTSKSVKNIQISVLEQIGIEERGAFYEATGAMRDMLQNHMMQMLSLFLMDACDIKDAFSVRSGKVDALKNLCPLDSKNDAVYAQYARNGEILGYSEESNVAKDSRTETFVALRLESRAKRWQGVKIYLRHGKRMRESSVRVCAEFKESAKLEGAIAHLKSLGAVKKPAIDSKRVVIFEIQPKARVVLRDGHFDYELILESGVFPYQKLISSVTKSNRSYFVHKDELYLSWSYLDELIHAEKPIFTYLACDDMPKQAYDLINQDKNSWV